MIRLIAVFVRKLPCFAYDRRVMKVLATGAAGFIGSEHVRSLLSGDLPGAVGVPVTVLDKLSYSGNLANPAAIAGHPGCRFVQGDICDDEVCGSISRGLARAAVDLSGLEPDLIRPLTSDHFRRPARRPAFSVLSHAGRDRTGIAPLAGWRDMLADALDRPAFAAFRGGPR